MALPDAPSFVVGIKSQRIHRAILRSGMPLILEVRSSERNENGNHKPRVRERGIIKQDDVECAKNASHLQTTDAAATKGCKESIKEQGSGDVGKFGRKKRSGGGSGCLQAVEKSGWGTGKAL